MKQIISISLFVLFGVDGLSQSVSEITSRDSVSQKQRYITVHFLYGSKPARKYRTEESKWFGGILGGHVGIEVDSNRILNFSPSGSFHVFSKKKKEERHSCYRYHNYSSFYSILGGHPDSMKQLRVRIPLDEKQSRALDSIEKVYSSQTPYDYAFFGYRCGAAAYDILAKLGLVKKYGFKRTYRKIFYPRKLRKRLIRKAKKNGWQMERKHGTRRRIWERD